MIFFFLSLSYFLYLTESGNVNVKQLPYANSFLSLLGSCGIISQGNINWFKVLIPQDTSIQGIGGPISLHTSYTKVLGECKDALQLSL